MLKGRETMRLVANLFAALLVLLTAQAGSAQSNYPNHPVKILVGFTPGTAPDLAARILVDRFAEVWGTPFVVENVPGAGSNIATERVANRHQVRQLTCAFRTHLRCVDIRWPNCALG
jgi:tripartite-type tricarboxylate transporter receptor subunit TctC